jgi:NAD(P)-dependent dehydrogenase (short-subunit alcohol dehydrogenase family)
MARVLVTGSVSGLGRAAAQALLADGHDVTVHARSARRATDADDLVEQGAAVVVGDLAELDEVRDLAGQVARLAPFDAVIHNAGVLGGPDRQPTSHGHPTVLTVNVLAPYLLTALVARPRRLVVLSSDMHHRGTTCLDDIEWTERRWNRTQAYSDSKLLVTVLAAAIARRWPDVPCNAVDPGWVPTRMGGPAASDDLQLGHETQVWLATSEDPAATTTGGYWYHRRRRSPAAGVHDADLQDRLLLELARLTGTSLAGDAP